MDYNDDLFNDEALDKKSTYDSGSSERGQDGLFRVDLSKVSHENKNRGYRAELRFLPNITDNPDYVEAYAGDKYNEDMKTALGPSHYQKVSHYLNFTEESMKDVKGWYDDPTNVNPKTQRPYTNEKWGPLAKTYFALSGSKDVVTKERANFIKYTKKYFSYVLVLKDEQQPELEGKIMIFSYGKQIKDIIESEENGETTGLPCNVFNLHAGKDFVLLAKEKSFTINGKEIKAPDYTKSRFYEEVTPISLPIKGENGAITFKKVPLDENNRIKPELRSKIRDFLLSRDIEIEAFAGREWTEEQQAKVTEAIDYLTGKTSAVSRSNSASADPQDKVEDFSFDDVSTNDESSESETSDEDEDFADLNF